ncbi:thiol-disulfide isomerase/thioredoxin [Hephaestia caeni]|uniref:Thiol-disulfide isomerase/thioredoxin n=1 Tax=Hephaestia caeni TaxID=645617 RepID=A0A397P4Q8_9SPHN|nr:thiol-disulfide isomerase/thioredoxin [Hephaestia caeni]
MRALIPFLLVATLMIGGCDRAKPGAEQASGALADANQASPDEVAASPDEVAPGGASAVTQGEVDRSHKGEAASAVSFTAPDGKTVTLADFKGTPVLLNLWATWCAPCVAELPTLDALAVQKGAALHVLTVSQDIEGKAKAAPFLKQKGITHLPAYTDPKLEFSLAYQANLPTTILFDAEGREVWRLSGGFDWMGKEAAALIAEAG